MVYDGAESLPEIAQKSYDTAKKYSPEYHASKILEIFDKVYQKKHKDN